MYISTWMQMHGSTTHTAHATRTPVQIYNQTKPNQTKQTNKKKKKTEQTKNQTKQKEQISNSLLKALAFRAHPSDRLQRLTDF